MQADSADAEARAVDQLFEMAVVLGDLMNRRLAANGLTPARGEVIWLLHHHGALSQRELSRRLGCSPRNVTGLVDHLEDAGFVARTRHPTDRRAVLVSLTSRGTAIAEGWRTDRDEGTAQLFAGTSPGDLVTFAAVLDRVLTKLRTSGVTPRKLQSSGHGGRRRCGATGAAARWK